MQEAELSALPPLVRECRGCCELNVWLGAGEALGIFHCRRAKFLQAEMRRTASAGLHQCVWSICRPPESQVEVACGPSTLRGMRASALPAPPG